MPLVTYPDSDSDSSSDPETTSNGHPSAGREEIQAPNKPVTSSSTQAQGKRKRPTQEPALGLPPLPSSFHDLYATNVRTSGSDDPSHHGGRKRQVPHQEGHWPSHVYLEWHPTTQESQRLRDMITRVTGASESVHLLLQSELGAPLPLHISLSRTLSLTTGEREGFLARLRSNVRESGMKTFEVAFDRLAWYANFERNRWFLSLGTAKLEGNELNGLLHVSNEACHATGQPELYVPRRATNGDKKARMKVKTNQSLTWMKSEVPDCSSSFHVSLAWSLEAQELSNEQHLTSLEELQTLSVSFDCVKVKIGNTVTSVPLKAARRGSSTAQAGFDSIIV